MPPSLKPVYLKHQDEEALYVRYGPGAESFSVSEVAAYVAQRFGGGVASSRAGIVPG